MSVYCPLFTNLPSLQAPVSAVPPAPPAPIPLSGEDSVSLLEAWRNLEVEYCASVRAALRKCRQEREVAVADCRAVKTEFLDFLKRQDGKQRSVDEFQVRWRGSTV